MNRCPLKGGQQHLGLRGHPLCVHIPVHGYARPALLSPQRVAQHRYGLHGRLVRLHLQRVGSRGGGPSLGVWQGCGEESPPACARVQRARGQLARVPPRLHQRCCTARTCALMEMMPHGTSGKPTPSPLALGMAAYSCVSGLFKGVGHGRAPPRLPHAAPHLLGRASSRTPVADAGVSQGRGASVEGRHEGGWSTTAQLQLLPDGAAQGPPHARTHLHKLLP